MKHLEHDFGVIDTYWQDNGSWGYFVKLVNLNTGDTIFREETRDSRKLFKELDPGTSYRVYVTGTNEAGVVCRSFSTAKITNVPLPTSSVKGRISQTSLYLQKLRVVDLQQGTCEKRLTSAVL